MAEQKRWYIYHNGGYHGDIGGYKSYYVADQIAREHFEVYSLVKKHPPNVYTLRYISY